MSDLTSQRLPLLKATRLPGLPTGETFLYPHYAGNSILNIPDTVCRLLGAPEISGRPLEGLIYRPLGEGIRRVVTILVDALALHRLQRWMEDGTAPVWRTLRSEGVLAPLTSITPSTTCAALTTLWTGRSPNEHGIVGYELWLKEYGVVANMITHGPIQFQGGGGSLEKAGFKPEEYLPFPTLGSHLSAHGIEAHAFQHYTINGSGLSRMFLKDAQMHPYGSAAELWVNVRALLEQNPGKPLYSWVYWSTVDTMAHRYGPDDEHAAGDFALFSYAFEHFFLNPLSKAARKDTAILLLADHGQIATPINPRYELRTHLALDRMLHINPTGEHRLFFLYPRSGQSEAVARYVEETWGEEFRLLDSRRVLESGLYGPGVSHPALGERIGDLTGFSSGQAYLWWPMKDNPLLGRHGGLHPQEMLVPFLGARLG